MLLLSSFKYKKHLIYIKYDPAKSEGLIELDNKLTIVYNMQTMSETKLEQIAKRYIDSL